MLTSTQLSAINHFKGPALVLAVPGAGKTTVIIHRTYNLINKYKIDAKEILSLTFSRSSAKDMNIRYMDSFQNSKPIFSTIHSFCFQVLEKYSYQIRKKYYLIEGNKSKINKYNILRNIYLQINNSIISEDKMENLLNKIGYVKNMIINVDDIELKDIKNFPLIYRKYEEIKEKNNFIDFDDLLTLTFNILSNNPNIRDYYRSKYKFIQVDEAQDTSKIQMEILKLLALPKNNIFLVADDDQSIYGFRGANPDGLLNFKKDFKNGKVFFMEENFRSSKNIVDLSNKLINKNKIRYKKNIFTNNRTIRPVQIIKLKNIDQQYKYIIQDIKKKSYKNNCILYRNNLSSLPLINELADSNISFSIKDKNHKFFNHWILKDIENFITFSKDTSNISLYKKIFYKKKGFISNKQINYAYKLNSNMCVFQRIRDYPALNNFYLKNLNNLELSFKKLAKLKPYDALEFILYDLDYYQYLKEYSDKFSYNFSSLLQVINTLMLIAKKVNNFSELSYRLGYLKNLHCKEDNSNITLSTIHSAKGLEFDNVYIIDLIQGEFPSSSSLDKLISKEEEEFEEERRLFYVAMTRAKYFLTLIVYKRIANEEINYSQFIDDLL